MEEQVVLQGHASGRKQLVQALKEAVQARLVHYALARRDVVDWVIGALLRALNHSKARSSK